MYLMGWCCLLVEHTKYVNDVGNGAQKLQKIDVQAQNKPISLFIQNGKRVFQPCVLEGITWATERKGAPGKLTFKVMKDAGLDFAEGNVVKFYHDNEGIFMGYVFTKRRDKDGAVTVTAYDQLRYLKNKNIYQFTNEKASDIIQELAADFQLEVGDIEDTEYVIPKYRGSNETLFDIIQFALDHTVLYGRPDPDTEKKKLYVLYDDFGKLTLKCVENRKIDLLIDAETAENYSYESSIDQKTYNKIKLYYDNKESGKREAYYAFDSANIARWGVLQMTESINPKQTGNPADKVNALLALYNRVQRSLSIKGALGDHRVRAGTILYVQLHLGDIILGAHRGDEQVVVPMLVESARHKFSESHHSMDLVLKGNAIQ